METPAAFIPTDRYGALMRGEALPQRMEGSVLFADLSGFTRLTEKLVTVFGATAAVDRLTTQLNLVFSALIDQVIHFDGTVVSFGGDALSCWFHGDQGLRATTCAFAMQQVMHQFANINVTGSETVALALKVGLTSGQIRRFIVGDPSIQLFDVMAGHAMLELNTVLHQIKQGEIRIGSGALKQIEHAVVIADRCGKNQAQLPVAILKGLHPDVLDQVTKAALPKKEERLPTLPVQTEIRQWLLQPVYKRVSQGQGRFLNDIRPVVVLFVKLNGLDCATDEGIAAKFDAYVRWVQQTLARFGGFLLKVTIDDKGNYLLAAFGAPESHSDDAERAAAAAIELRKSPATFPFITSVQIGLHQGRLLAGAFGNKRRAAYDLLGSAVNLTSRFMLNAAHNQILASKQLVEAISTKFQFGPPTVSSITGVGALDLYELQDRLPLSRPLYEHPMLDREAEMQSLSHLLEGVVAGQGQIVWIEGEAGVGKSRLVTEFSTQAATRGCTVATGVCESITQSIAYYPWQQILSTLPCLDNPYTLQDEPGLSDFLGLTVATSASATNLDPQERQSAIFAFVTNLLRTAAQKRPLVLVFDDIHWLDQASIHLLKVFCRIIDTVPIMLVLVQRPLAATDGLLPELHRLPYFQRLALAPLSRNAIKHVVEEQLTGTVSPLLLSFIEMRAQGNPFYAEELALALYELNLLEQQTATNEWNVAAKLFVRLQQAHCLIKEPTSGEWLLHPAAALSTLDLGIPDTIHQLVLSRLDHLPEECRQTIQIASVIGRSFTLALLAQVHAEAIEPATLREQLNLLELHLLVVPSATEGELQYEFRHHITQAVTYAAMVETRRQTLHAAVGQALERVHPQAVERLAYHFSRGHLREKSIAYLALAAQHAQQTYANQAALNYYNQLLALEERWAWLCDKLAVLHGLGLREEEQKTLEKLAKWPNADLYTVCYWYGQYYEAISNYELAEQFAGQAFANATAQQKPVDQARCLALLSLVARRLGHYEQSQTYCQSAIHLLQQQQPGDEAQQILVDLYNNLGYIYRQQADYPQAQLVSERALQLCRDSGNRRGEVAALNTLAAVAYYQREFRNEARYREQAIQIQRQIGDLAGEGTNLYNLAIALYERGHFEAAETWTQAALQVHQTTGNRREEINVRNLLSILHYQFGEFDAATAELQHSLQLCLQISDEAGRGYTLCNLGMLLRDQSQLEAAAEQLAASWQLAEAQADKYLSAMCQSHLAVVRLIEGKFETAIHLAQQALMLREAIGVPGLTTIDLTTLAQAYCQLGKQTQALTYVEQAVERLAESHAVGAEFPHRDYFTCFTVLHKAGRQAAATAALHAAYQLVSTRAEQISNPTRRQTFLNLAPGNGAIINAFTQKWFEKSD